MTDLDKPVSRPWRRFLRLSVRGMIGIVIVISAGLGWVVRSAHIQRDAVAAIASAGGTVKYEWEQNSAVGMAPEDSHLHSLRAASLFALGRLDEAKHERKIAVELYAQKNFRQKSLAPAVPLQGRQP